MYKQPTAALEQLAEAILCTARTSSQVGFKLPLNHLSGPEGIYVGIIGRTHFPVW